MPRPGGRVKASWTQQRCRRPEITPLLWMWEGVFIIFVPHWSLWCNMAVNKARVDRDALLTIAVYSDPGCHCLLILCTGVTTDQVLDSTPTFNFGIIDILKESSWYSKQLWQSYTHAQDILSLFYLRVSLWLSAGLKKFLWPIFANIFFYCKNQISSTETSKLRLEKGTYGPHEQRWIKGYEYGLDSFKYSAQKG